MTTLQQMMEQKLGATGIPAKEIRVFGSSILVTCYSRKSADKFASVISRFARIRGVVESVDYAKENNGTCLCPTTIKVWRVGAAL